MATAAPVRTSWKWQLRDSKGRWIEMGAKVKWLARGQSFEGVVSGSPGPGYVVVQDANGTKHRLPSNRITVTEAAATAAPDQQRLTPALKSTALRRTAATEPAPALARVTKGATPEERKSRASKAAPSMAHLTPKGRRAVKEINEIIDTDVAPENREEAKEAVVDVVVGEVADRFPDDAKELGPIKKILEKATMAKIKLDLFLDSHEKVGKLLDKAVYWADEYFSDIWGGSTTSPGIGGAFMTLGFSNPFSNPIEFVGQVAHHAQGLIEIGEQLIRLLGSGQPAIARRVREA